MRSTLVVNIGIGGSDLGPAMAVEALSALFRRRAANRLRLERRWLPARRRAGGGRSGTHAVHRLLEDLHDAGNAHERRYAPAPGSGRSSGEEAVPEHFAAVSVNAPAMDAFGIHPDYRFAMWDWVGGRYSIWSSIGVSLAVADRPQPFPGLPRRWRARWTSISVRRRGQQNLPALMGLLGVWNIDFLALPTLAVLPYDDRLARFPAYLQQLEMESNGKSVRIDGSPVFAETAPVIWGEPGNNAAALVLPAPAPGHAARGAGFPVAGAAPAAATRTRRTWPSPTAWRRPRPSAYGQQSGAAAEGPCRAIGPATSSLFARLDPVTLGRLVALYEHKVFTQSVVWGINAFDQWGVELGKKLAEQIAPLVQGQGEAQSTTLRGSLACSRI